MKIYLKDQTDNFGKLLTELMTRPVMAFDKTKLREKITTIGISCVADLRDIDLAFFFDYNIFPANIMSFMTQWQLEKRRMKVGDTILQQAFIPPISTFSQKIVFGVRINNIIEDTDRVGFSYETIEGHVEKGESTFTIERGERALVFKIRTFSTPGNLLTKLAGPFFTSPYQAYCTKKALEHVKQQVESQRRL